MWKTSIFSTDYPHENKAFCGSSFDFSTGCGKQCGKNVVLHTFQSFILWVFPKFPSENEKWTGLTEKKRLEVVENHATGLWKKYMPTKTPQISVDIYQKFSTDRRVIYFHSDKIRVPKTENSRK